MPVIIPSNLYKLKGCSKDDWRGLGIAKENPGTTLTPKFVLYQNKGISYFKFKTYVFLTKDNSTNVRNPIVYAFLTNAL